MENIKLVIQLILALGIYNVWIINYTKGSKYRGGKSNNMSEEFEAYGFKSWFMKFIGLSKLTLATLLIAGIWFPAFSKSFSIFNWNANGRSSFCTSKNK